MNIDKLFLERKSIRSFSDKEVEKDTILELLNATRLAPSAVNKQPWRVVVADNAAHFYLQRRKGSTNESHEGKLDMQKVDLGIALCHFALTAEENGLVLEFLQEEPGIARNFEGEYIGTYRIK